jgi:hypothetical protein
VSSQHHAARATQISAVVVFVLAILFFLFFDVEKHTPAFIPVNPFATDPYDAIGSYAIQAAFVCGALAVFRAFRLSPSGVPTAEQRLLLIRTQLAAVLAVIITLLGDVVALVRHTSIWVGSGAGYALSALVGGLLLMALIVATIVARAGGARTIATSSRPWAQALVVSLVALLALALYPEELTQTAGIPGALLTVIVGALLLFVPLWAVVTALVPYAMNDSLPSVLRWLRQHPYVLGAVVLAGMAVGLAVYAREGMVEGVPRDVAKVARVALVYMSLEAAGVLIGFVALSRSLGLLPAHRRRPTQ